jgi:hypothetical protein
MELGARTQPERGTLGVLGELEPFGESRMVVERVAVVLDQAIVQRHQEVVGGGGAVVLLRIEPARRDVGVPGERQLALRHHGAALVATRSRPRRSARQDAGLFSANRFGLASSRCMLPPMAAQDLCPRRCLLR